MSFPVFLDTCTLVGYDMTDTSARRRRCSTSSQKLRDAAGREADASSDAAAYLGDTNAFLNTINPGNSVTGQVVFDIPADTQPAGIELHDSPFSGGVTVSLAR